MPNSDDPYSAPSAAPTLVDTISKDRLLHRVLFGLVLIVWYSPFLLAPGPKGFNVLATLHESLLFKLIGQDQSLYPFQEHPILFLLAELAFVVLLCVLFIRRSAMLTSLVLIGAICWNVLNFGVAIHTMATELAD